MLSFYRRKIDDNTAQNSHVITPFQVISMLLFAGFSLWKHAVENAIAAVPDAKQRTVLTRQYINGWTWEKIAVDLDRSYQWVCELHGRALQKLFPAS